MNHSDSERWLPVSFNFSPTAASVRWVAFGHKRLSEPFFNHTVQHLRKSIPAAPERSTALTALLEAAAPTPHVEPAGVIFHVSRCGSTLLANVLKTGKEVVVMAEANPFGILFQPRLFHNSALQNVNPQEIRKLLLDSVVRLYAAAFGSRLIIKCHAATILEIALIRSVWPTVPFLVLIRDPVEVMVSNLAKPSGWVRSMYRSSTQRNLFGLEYRQIHQMSMEEYCARGLGRFLQAAVEQLDRNCWVLDYDDLNVSNLYKVSQLFHVSLPTSDSPEFQEAFLSYSKYRSTPEMFQGDRERKQREAPPSLRSWAAQWAQEPYRKLRKEGSFPLNI
jgi:hypothetical protein